MCVALQVVVCPFVLFLLTIVLFVLLRFTDNDYPFAVFKLILDNLCKCYKYVNLLFVASYSSSAIRDSYIENQFNDLVIKVMLLLLQCASIESFATNTICINRTLCY